MEDFVLLLSAEQPLFHQLVQHGDHGVDGDRMLRDQPFAHGAGRYRLPEIPDGVHHARFQLAKHLGHTLGRKAQRVLEADLLGGILRFLLARHGSDPTPQI
jgi:hypothetical protein